MKSDFFALGGASDIQTVPEEIERLGLFCKLSGGDAMKLRLLTEEMISLVRAISDNYTGKLWAETKGGTFSLHMEIDTIVGEASKENLLTVSGGVNYATKGVMGKLSSFFSGFASALAVSAESAYFTQHPPLTGYSMMDGYTPVWSLNEYQKSLTDEEKTREWDGLEKSILVNFADESLVGVKENRIIMVVKKAF